MKKRVVFLVSHPFTDRDYSRFGISFFEKLGMTVDVIDLFDLFYPRKVRFKLQSQTTITHNICQINNLKDTFKLLGEYHLGTSVIAILPENEIFNKIIKFLNINKVIVVTINATVLPLPRYSIKYGAIPAMRSAIAIFINSFLFKVKKFCFFRSLPQLDAVFFGGTRGIYDASELLMTAKKKISVHALDYDIFLKNNNTKLKNDKSYILFLDQFLPHHPDIYLQNSDNNQFNDEIVEKYYFLMNDYFTELEKKYCCKVVIAAHPRADYVFGDSRFLGREIIYNRIAKLVQNAKFCVTHWSTSINFAILFEKPLVFVYMDIFKLFISEYDLAIAKGMVTELGSSFVSIDKGSINLKIPNVDKEVYSQYMNNYIKEEGTEDKFFWEIVASSILDMSVECAR